MSVTRPRGPLPARVYWTRRVLVLGVAFALVLGISRLLGGGSSDPQPAARAAAAESPGRSAAASPSATPTAVSTADAQAAPAQSRGGQRARDRTPLAMPTGPCRDSDVRVAPALRGKAYAGGNVRLTLALSTQDSPACTWQVSPDTVAVRLTSGSDRIWSSQDCPRAVRKQNVVLRNDRRTLVDVIWSGRRSDPSCSRTTQWAEPGYYHVSAAAMGADPQSQQFRLLPPAPVTITPTPTPQSGSGSSSQGASATASPSH